MVFTNNYLAYSQTAHSMLLSGRSGIELVMYPTDMYRLFVSKRHRLRKTSRLFLAVYSSLLFVLVTIDVSTNPVRGEQMWITYRDRPGGVPAYIASQVSVWYETLSSTSVIVMIFMGDALLSYRLFIIFGSNYFLILIPCLAWCSAFALAIIQLIVAGKPGGDFFGGKTINFAYVYGQGWSEDVYGTCSGLDREHGTVHFGGSDVLGVVCKAERDCDCVWAGVRASHPSSSSSA